MPAAVSCPNCKSPLMLADELRGRHVKCDNCQIDLTISDDFSSISSESLPTVVRAPNNESDEEPSPAPRRSNAKSIIVVLAAVAGIILVCGGILLAVLLPAVQHTRETARQSKCKYHLKQIGLAIHNYHDSYGSFPPAYIPDKSGRPMHSWRVLILPLLDEQDLYSRYNFSEPWNGPNNRLLLAQRPAIYSCGSEDRHDGTSSAYAAVFGDACAFRKKSAIRRSDITDGVSRTMLIGEAVDANIPWTKPEDVEISVHGRLGDPQGFTSRHAGGFHAIMSDGSVRMISNAINQKDLDGMYTISGHEIITGDF